MGVDLAVMGEKQGRDADDEVVTYAEPARGIYKKLIVRDGKLAGAILLGDASAAPALLQVFDRSTPLPDSRASLLFPMGEAQAPLSAADLPDDAQICNCNGVSKGAHRRRAARRLPHASRRSATRPAPAPAAARARSRSRRSSRRWPATTCRTIRRRTTTCPACRWPSAELVAAIKEHGPAQRLAGVRRARRPARRIRAARPGSPRCSRPSGATTYDDERDARFINDRVHANIQKDGTFSVVPRIFGGVTTRRRAAPDRRRRRQVQRADGEDHRRPAHRPARASRKEQLPDVWKDLGMPSGHAYTKAFRTCKTCVGTRVLPLRRRRLAPPSASPSRSASRASSRRPR